jgi:hypothetical protein
MTVLEVVHMLLLKTTSSIYIATVWHVDLLHIDMLVLELQQLNICVYTRRIDDRAAPPLAYFIRSMLNN